MDTLTLAQQAASASGSSLWSLFYQHSQHAFAQLFSVLDKDWLKGRPCAYGATVRTDSGPVRGKTFTVETGPEGHGTGRRVNAWLGIPYARAGTGQDRFKKPFPVEPWLEPLDCTKYGPRAVQHDMFWDVYITPTRQHEANCLHISVFAPDWESAEFKKSGRPVIVFVHGGGFLIHSAANYGDWNICQNVCRWDVLVCVVQYRLGLLGFLSTGDDRCPGNFGLWDQLAAFKWVQQNIGAFGGDPSNVTAFGQSAGAAAIDLLSISPLAKGLFRRVILMGGNGCADWALVSPQRTQEAAKRMARRIGWKGQDGDLHSLLDFLRNTPARKLGAPLVGKSAFNRHKKGLDFCPVVDGELIPDRPDRLRLAMDWPLEIIVGATQFEALLFVGLGRNQCDLESMRKYLQIYIPAEIPQADALRTKCEQLYLEKAEADGFRGAEKVHTAFLRLHSDLMINNSVQRYCQAMMANGRHRIYLYNMTHFNKDEFGFVGFRMPFVAATHCHDVRYMLGKGLYSKFRPNWDDRKMLRIFGALFTNFAKYGNPNGHWRLKRGLAEEKNSSEEGESADDRCCPPWNASAEPASPDSEFVAPAALAADDCARCCWWEELAPEDSYKHLELCLEPKMRSKYQGGRYEFWRENVETKMAEKQ